MCHTFVSPYKPDACSSIGGLYRPLRLLPAPPEFDPTAAGLAVLVFSGTPASLPANFSPQSVVWTLCNRSLISFTLLASSGSTSMLSNNFGAANAMIPVNASMRTMGDLSIPRRLDPAEGEAS